MIYLLIFVLWVLLMVCALALFSRAPRTSCTGNCGQGRTCACRGDRDA